MLDVAAESSHTVFRDGDTDYEDEDATLDDSTEKRFKFVEEINPIRDVFEGDLDSDASIILSDDSSDNKE